MCIIFVKKMIPRPKSDRFVLEPHLFSDFKPTGVRGQDLEHILLTFDEFKTFRLADYKVLLHAEVADEMEISRSTFTRLNEKARNKIADFIIQGKLLIIEVGSIHFRHNIIFTSN